MPFGLELEIRGDSSSLTEAVRETKDEYGSLTKSAERNASVMADAAERTGRQFKEIEVAARSAAAGYSRSAAESAQASTSSSAAMAQSLAVAMDYADALESAESAANEYTRAMEDAAAVQTSAAARAAQANEMVRGRVVRAFDTIKTKVVTTSRDIAAAWKASASSIVIDTAKLEAAQKRIADASLELQRKAVNSFRAIQLAAAGLATATIVSGASFEQSMARVGAVTNAAPAQLKAMSDEARRWGETTSFGAKSVAQAMAVIADSSGDAVETIAATGPVVKLAGATMIELSEAADLVAQTLDAFNLKGQDGDRVVNVFAASIGKIDMNSLRAGLSNVAAAAGNVGLSVEQTVAMLAILDQQGQKATKSAAGLQGIFSALLNPSDDLRELMGGLSVETHGVMAVMQELASKGPEALSRAFDARQLQVIISLAKAGPEAFEAMTNSLTGTNRALEMFQRNQQTVQSQFLILRNMVAGVMIAAFQELSGVSLASIQEIQAAVIRYKDRIVDAVRTTRDWIVAHKDQLVAIAEVVVKIGPAILAFGLLLRAVRGVVDAVVLSKTTWFLFRGLIATTVIPTVNAFSVALGGTAIATGAMAGPIGIAAIAIAGLIGVIARFRKELDYTSAEVPKTFEGVRDELAQTEARAARLRHEMTQGDPRFATAYIQRLEETEKRLEQLREAFAKVSKESVAGLASMEGGLSAVARAGDAARVSLVGLAELARIGSSIKPPKIEVPDTPDPAGTNTQTVRRVFEEVGPPAPHKPRALPIVPFFDEQKMSEILRKSDDMTEASLILQSAKREHYTSEWLSAQEALITHRLQKELSDTETTSSQAAQARINAEASIAAVREQYQDAFIERWRQDHLLIASYMEALGHTYDDVVNLMIRKQESFERIRTALADNFRRTFISNVSAMFKALIAEQLKASVLTESFRASIAGKEKVQQAKAGAREAYKSMAGIPIVGPALGVAAAAAAFAFLMTFHRGGYLSDTLRPQRGNERLLIGEVGEYMVQRKAVDSVGRDTLDYINRTGRLPNANGAPGSVSLSFQISGGADPRGLKDWIEEVIVPQIQEAVNDGRFRGTLLPRMV